MIIVREMVEHFERIVRENHASEFNPLSLTPHPEKPTYNDDDDELLSYDDDSENDLVDDSGLNSSNPIEGKNELNVNKEHLDEDERAAPQPLKTPNNSSRNSEDCYNYSSDDETTLPQMSPLIALQSLEDIHDDNLESFPSFKTTTSTNLHEDQSFFDVINSQGQSPLTIASMNCSSEAINIFILKGFNVNLPDMNGSTPLHYVCMHEANDDQQTCMRLLLENGALVNVQDHLGRTPLHKAAENNSIKNMKLLLSYGACPRIPDSEGNLPLHEVTKAINIEGIELLSRSNKNCHKKWCVPSFRVINDQEMMSVAPQCNDDIQGKRDSQVYGDGEANINESNEHHGSLNPRSMEIWNRFFDQAINVHNPSMLPDESEVEIKYEHKYPLHNSIYMGDDIDLVKDLIEQVHDIDQLDENMNTPLHVAALKGHFPTIQLLVTKGAQIDCLNNNDRQTPLSICISRGHTKCANYLMRHCSRYSVIVEKSDQSSPSASFFNGLFVSFIEYIKFFYNCYRWHSKMSNDASTTMNNLQSDKSMPEDVAIALSKARENENMTFRTMQPPEDLQLALKQAGIIDPKNSVCL